MKLIVEADRLNKYYGALSAIISFKKNYAGEDSKLLGTVKDCEKELSFIKSFLTELENSDLDYQTKNMFIRSFLEPNENNVMLDYFNYVTFLKEKGKFEKWFNKGLKEYDKVIEPMVLNLEKRLGVKATGAIFADESKYNDFTAQRNVAADNLDALNKLLYFYTKLVTRDSYSMSSEIDNGISDAKDTNVIEENNLAVEYANLEDYRHKFPEEFEIIEIPVTNHAVKKLRKPSILQRTRAKLTLRRLNIKY